jgi:TPR repeat protein
MIMQKHDSCQGVKQDYSQAKTYCEKACSMNNGSGCFNVGNAYNDGKATLNHQILKSCSLPAV